MSHWDNSSINKKEFYQKLDTKAIDIVELQRNVALFRNDEAFKTLFLYFYGSLTNFAYSITKSEEAAEEIYSDVMLKIWDLGESLQGINNLKSYLYRAIKNTSLNYLEKYHKLQSIDFDSISIEILPLHDADAQILANEFNRFAIMAIKSLPPKCQIVYKLIREDGLSYKDVSEILNISVNTVEGHMVNALKKLQKSLGIFLHPAQN